MVDVTLLIVEESIELGYLAACPPLAEVARLCEPEVDCFIVIYQSASPVQCLLFLFQ